jgi:hypothetical protein
MHEFCDHCPGCQPCMFDLKTGKVMAADSPRMLALQRVWRGQTSYAQRKAFINVTYHNSRKSEELRLAHQVIALFEKSLP